jgi:hypothetical protein
MVYTNCKNPLSINEVINALTITGEKLLIGNKKVTSQISWAPDNKIEIVTINNRDHSIRNHLFCTFNGVSTINWIRNKSYKNCEFYFGYIKD